MKVWEEVLYKLLLVTRIQVPGGRDFFLRQIPTPLQP